jgi:hypothetical protein
MRMFASVVLVPVLWALGAGAQVAMAPATGSVAGHVTCGDTQRPARFAQVLLFGVPKDVPDAPATPPDPTNAAAIKAAMNSAMGQLNLVQTETGTDGSYSLERVMPGDYYVFASVAGYVQPSNLVQAAVDSGADMSKPIPGIPVVHVAAERGSMVDLTAERGAAISGKVVWDDGSPVAKAVVTVESTKSTGKKLPPQYAMLSAMSAGLGSGGMVSISDDLGHYRIAGLAAGDYRVKATMQLRSSFAMQGGVMNMRGLGAEKPMVIYAPAVLHKAEAKPVAVKQGDEMTDEVVTVNLAGMHSVSGRVASMEDHHGINSATVMLTDGSDKDVVRGAAVDKNGNYTVMFVPSGTYALTVEGAEDTEPGKKPTSGLIRFSQDHAVRSYNDGEASVIVADSDVTGQNLELAPSKTTKKDLDLNDLIK